VSDDFVEQATQAMRNIVEVLACDGATPAHLVRLTWYVTDRDQYIESGAALGAAYREIFGRVYPAMSAVQVCALMEEDALVEIEATAIVPDEPA
jgi:enamine deaminase RidA (YjgF/YER057c/UK114 family)